MVSYPRAAPTTPRPPRARLVGEQDGQLPTCHPNNPQAPHELASWVNKMVSYPRAPPTTPRPPRARLVGEQDGRLPRATPTTPGPQAFWIRSMRRLFPGN